MPLRFPARGRCRRSGHSGARLAATLAIAIAAATTAAPAGAQDTGAADAARAYLAEARGLAEAGDWVSAAALLDEGRAQDPTDSDIRYLSALASQRIGFPIGSALSELGAALAASRFADYSRRDTILFQAELLARERRWPEALAALSALPRDRGDDAPERLIRLRALRGSGEAGEYLSEMGAALARFPDDPSFPRLFLEYVEKAPRGIEERKIADLVIARRARYATVDPEIPLLAAALLPAGAARRDAVLAYRSSGGTSSTATLRALEYGIISEASAAAEFFAGSYPARLSDLEELLNLCGSPSGRDAVLSTFARWSGDLLADRDRDGIAEERCSFASALTIDWSLDADQDGAVDLRIAFAAGLPVAAMLQAQGASLSFSYGAYPSLATLSLRDGNETRSYSFAPEALAFMPLSLETLDEGNPYSAFIPRPTGAVPPSERAAASIALSLATRKGAESSLVLLDRGRALTKRSFLDGRLSSEIEYRRGLPALERLDADGDGRFETEREYDQAGAAVSVRVDSDGDGLSEYAEASLFPFRKEWDLDADGRFDAVQYKLADGSTRREFSSRLDGRFDEAMTLRDGRIVAFSREGETLALVPDVNPAIAWIGTKPFDIGGERVEAGVFSRGGTKYRVTAFGDRAFAEILP